MRGRRALDRDAVKTLNPTEDELAAIQARIAKRSKVTAVRGAYDRKYHNEKTVVDQIKFDSKREAKRYGELKLLEHAGEITELTRQPEFICDVRGVRVCKYFADFSYLTPDGRKVVEDAKGYRTPVYRLKKKLVAAIFGVEIVEV